MKKVQWGGVALWQYFLDLNFLMGDKVMSEGITTITFARYMEMNEFSYRE